MHEVKTLNKELNQTRLLRRLPIINAAQSPCPSRWTHPPTHILLLINLRIIWTNSARCRPDLFIESGNWKRRRSCTASARRQHPKLITCHSFSQVSIDNRRAISPPPCSLARPLLYLYSMWYRQIGNHHKNFETSFRRCGWWFGLSEIPERCWKAHSS